MADTAVVDTDVLSFLVKDNTRAALYQRHVVGRSLAISFMTLAQLDQWMLLHNWSAAGALCGSLRSYGAAPSCFSSASAAAAVPSMCARC